MLVDVRELGVDMKCLIWELFRGKNPGLLHADMSLPEVAHRYDFDIENMSVMGIDHNELHTYASYKNWAVHYSKLLETQPVKQAIDKRINGCHVVVDKDGVQISTESLTWEQWKRYMKAYQEQKVDYKLENMRIEKTINKVKIGRYSFSDGIIEHLITFIDQAKEELCL